MNKHKNIRASVIGLGMIGSGIVKSLSNSGFIPGVHDLSDKALEKVEGISQTFDSPKAIAENSDVIMICVATSDQVRQVIIGAEGIIKSDKHDLIVCLISTISIPDVKEFSDICSQNNIDFIDCGVTPGNLAHKNGMVAMIGGNQVVVERAMPVLEGWSKKVVHCGPIGAGMVTKIARNVITFGSWRIVKEAQYLMQANDINPQKLVEVIETSDPNGETLLSRLKQNDTQGKIPIDSAKKILPLMIKDLNAAGELAKASGVKIPAFDAVLKNGLDTLDLQEPVNISFREEAKERGTKVADLVYGKEFGNKITENSSKNLYSKHTLEHLFADIWSRSGLSIRDRRLLTIGVTAASGNFPELIKIQVLGALKNYELTAEQLDEIILHLSYYAGWCKGGAVAKGISDALEEFNRKECK